ncbi:MAG: hypothetical protein MJK14_26430 [Rivularia sp. ALOHA_DT_140]|nr:hypothetical protein [Rivularia sp. ALOHA_DT_140]
MKFISGLFGGKKDGNGNFFLELKDEPDEPMPKAESKSVEASNNGKKPTATAQVDTVKVKDENSKVKQVPVDKVKEVDVNLVQTAKGVKAKAVPVENKKPSPVTAEAEENKETSFASKYLIPKNNNMRRRPGANMNSFLDMASQVKIPIQK